MKVDEVMLRRELAKKGVRELCCQTDKEDKEKTDSILC